MPEFIWTPDRIIHYPLIDHVHLSPNGGRVLFTVRTAHLTDDASEFRNQVMVALTEGDDEPIQLTFGEAASQPSWSPDGRHMAFLRNTSGASQGAGLWVMRLAGGEPWLLTGAGNGAHKAITRFAWSPDGKQLAFLSTPYDPESEKRRQQRADVLHWRADYDFEHLFVVDFTLPSGATNPAPAVKQLTQGRYHVLNLSWSPDGARLAFSHRPTPLLDTWPQTRLATIAADSSESVPTDLGAAPNWTGAVDYSPDGQWIATDISTEGSAWAYASRVALLPSQGGEPVLLADAPDAQPEVLGWAPDSNAVYVLNQHGTGSQVLAVPVDGSQAQLCVEGEFQFNIVHINSFGQAALVMHNFYEVNSVYIADLTGMQGPHTPTRAATPMSLDYPQGVLPQVRTLHWRTPDGFEIEGILYLPRDYEEQNEQKLPLMLHIHGGPASIFQRQFVGHPYYYTPAAFCERGIAVLRCNPRGSGGYGKEFRFANRHDWGGGDYRDLQQGIDEVVRLGIADPERLGICGWSYGGFMTSWTITQTDRFRAASIGAPVTNPMSFNATADIPSFAPDYFGGEAWEDLAFYQAHSPIFQVHRVQTPAIIQHGDADTRVPLEQGLQFFHALKRRGVPVEMYIYPRQGHALSEPRLLADALQRNLDWFTQMLLEI
jgi:dipeptidyl aminopeptidase/acylaminoacyl peptidase